ncbi:MAG TPA: glycosyltransferase family 87 protein, partial [Gemmataceae bacterium]|nr:glycosyltransferase family 87 protein [Gemmataceae bacterium]
LSWDGTTYRDFACFWRGGSDTRAGFEAYGEAFRNNRPFLNPPTALPLFAGLALLPLPTAYAVWTALNAGLVVGLVPLARRALAEDQSAAARGLDGATLLVLAAALALSNATRSNLINGQMAILTAFALLLAYLARGMGRWPLAGGALAVATVKVGTMLPFGMLFLTGRSRAVWKWLAAFVLLLCLATARVGDQGGRLERIAGEIGRLAGEGRVNDYSRAGPHSADILGLDKLFYHLGVGDRGLVRDLQVLSLALLGLALAAVVLRARAPRGLSASLLALYSVIFFYHRNYDAVILALPLAFAAGHARTANGRPRRWMAAAALMILLALYLPRRDLFALSHRTFESVLTASFVEYLVLPSATWLVLLGMLCLWVGARGLPPDEDLSRA